MSFFTIDPKSLATDWYRVFLDPLLLIYKALRLDLYIERFSYTFLRTLYLIKAVIANFFFLLHNGCGLTLWPNHYNS